MTRAPEDTDEPDVTNVRLEIVAGLAIGPRATARYRVLQHFGAGDSAYQEVSLRWSFDALDRFSLKTSVARPQDDYGRRQADVLNGYRRQVLNRRSLGRRSEGD